MSELTLDIQTNLLKTLDKVNKNLDSTQDLLTKNQKNFNKIDDTTEKIRDKYNDIEKQQRNINKHTEGFLSTLKKIAGIAFGGIVSLFSAAGIMDTVNAVLDAEQAFLDLSFRMGQSTKGVGQFNAAMHATIQATGLSHEKARELVSELARLRVPIKDIKDLSISAGAFSEVTGMSVQSTTRLIGNLTAFGKLGKSSTQQVMLGMAKIQREVGLTEGEMEQLGDEISTNTIRLHQMNKSEADIEKFAKGTAKLAGAFTKVGLSVTDAQSIVDKFLDPTQFVDNAYLMSQLGYSLADTIEGNIPSPDELNSKLKGLAQQVKGMGMAGVEMAKQLGIPYQQLMKMNDLSDTGKSGEGIKDAQSEFLKMQESQEGIRKDLEHTTNRIQGVMIQFGQQITPVIKNLTNALENVVKNFTSSLSKFFRVGLIIAAGAFIAFFIAKLMGGMKRASVDTSGMLHTGVTKALDMGSQKGSDIYKKRMMVAGRAVTEDYRKRVEESSGYISRQMKADYLATLSEIGMAGPAKHFLQSTEHWMRRISAGSKATSIWAAMQEANNKKIEERVKLTERENAVRKALIGGEIERANLAKETAQTQIDYIKSVEKQRGSLTGQEKQALSELYTLQMKSIKDATNAKVELEKFKREAEKREIEALKKMSAIQLEVRAKDLKTQIEEGKKQKQTNQEKIMQLSQEEKLLEASQKNLVIRKQELMVSSKSRALTSQEAKELYEINNLEKQIASEIEKGKNEKEELRTANKEIAAQELEILKQLDKQNEAKKGKEGNSLVEAQKGLYKVANFFGSVFRNAGSKLTEVGQKIGNSLTVVAKAAAERLNPKNWLANMKEAGLKGILFGREKTVIDKDGNEQVKQTKGLIKALGAVGATMGVFAIFGKVLAPIMQKLEPAITNLFTAIAEALFPVIQNLTIALAPILKPLLNILLTLTKAILPPLLGIAGKIVEVIGSLGMFIMELPQRINYVFEKITGKTEAKSFSDWEKEKFSLERVTREMKESLTFSNQKLGITSEASRLGLSGDALDKEAEKRAREKIANIDDKKNPIYALFKSLKEAGASLQGVDLSSLNGIDPNKLIDSLIASISGISFRSGEGGSIAGTGANATGDSIPVYNASEKGFIKDKNSGTDPIADTASNTKNAADASKQTANNTDKVAATAQLQASIQEQTLAVLTEMRELLKKATLGNKGVAQLGTATPRS